MTLVPLKHGLMGADKDGRGRHGGGCAGWGVSSGVGR